MKLNLQDSIVTLENIPAKNDKGELLSIGKVIAVTLVGGKTADPLRSYLLAKKVTETEKEIELDPSEIEFIKNTLKEFGGWTDLVVGQVLEKLGK